jgi:predicted acetyltransferase
VRRSEGHWKTTLAEKDKEVAVYDRDGEVEGYILYKISGWREDRSPHRTLSAREVAGTTPRAREAIFSFMAGLDPQVFEIHLYTSRGEPIHPYLRSSHVNAKIAPDQMLRLVDVEGALGYLKRKAHSPLVLQVSDDVIPENAGEYTLAEGKVVHGAEAEERVSLDVRQLAQLYAGYLPVRGLARHGLIETSSQEALELMETLFPVGDPSLFGPDHF